jgi:hypothetical protein
MDGDPGGDTEGGVREVVHASNLRASAPEGRRTFDFPARTDDRLELAGVPIV